MREMLRKAACIHLSICLALMGTGCAGMKPEADETTQAPAEMQQGASPVGSAVENQDSTQGDELLEASDIPISELTFSGLYDPAYIQYTQDALLADLEQEFLGEDVEVVEIYSIYVSKEYLEELEYNSLANVYFGYTLKEIEEQFGNERYVFTLGEDGHTVVRAFEGYDDYFNTVVSNVAIGGGVILTLVVLSIAAGPAGVPVEVAAILVSSAKGAAIGAASIGILVGVVGGIRTGIETGDMDAALETVVLSGSEGFKWGAIVGAVTGAGWGILRNVVASRAIPTPRQSEQAVLQLLGGSEQVSYLNGVEVPFATNAATRPDVVTQIGGETVAVEVKNYDLISNLYNLGRTLTYQLTRRAENLPEGMRQMVYLDVRNRGYSPEYLNYVVLYLQQQLSGIDGGIPIMLLQKL